MPRPDAGAAGTALEMAEKGMDGLFGILLEFRADARGADPALYGTGISAADRKCNIANPVP